MIKNLPQKVAVRVKKLMQVKSLDLRTVPGRGLGKYKLLLLLLVAVVRFMEFHFPIKSSEGSHPITVGKIVGWLGDSAVMFAFWLMAETDWQVQKCKWKHTTQSSPPHLALYLIKGIHGLADLVLGKSTSCLFRLMSTSLPQFSQKPGHSEACHGPPSLYSPVYKALLPQWPPVIPTCPPHPQADSVTCLWKCSHCCSVDGHSENTSFWSKIFSLVVLCRHTGRDAWQVSLMQTTGQGKYLGIWSGFIRRGIFFSWIGRIIKREKRKKSK